MSDLTELSSVKTYSFNVNEGYTFAVNRIYKIGRIVIFMAQISGIGSTGSSAVATVPDDLRPNIQMYFPLGHTTGTNTGSEYSYISSSTGVLTVVTGYAYEEILISGAYVTAS